jgi:hypothetical protein
MKDEEEGGELLYLLDQARKIDHNRSKVFAAALCQLMHPRVFLTIGRI